MHIDFTAVTLDLSRRIAADTDRAVREWAEQMGVTPKQWLEWFEPVVTMRYDDDAVRWTVEARVNRPNFPES